MSNIDQDISQIRNDIRDIKTQLNDMKKKLEHIENQTKKESDPTIVDILKGAFFADISRTLQRIEEKLKK